MKITNINYKLQIPLKINHFCILYVKLLLSHPFHNINLIRNICNDTSIVLLEVDVWH